MEPGSTGLKSRQLRTLPLGTRQETMQLLRLDLLDRPFLAPADPDFDFSFAFQPIVDVRSREIVSYEALVRGPNGEPSEWVFSRMSPAELPHFDEVCHRKAIALACRLKIDRKLNLNLTAQSIQEVDHSMSGIFQACLQFGMAVENIIFELVESENLANHKSLVQSLRLIQELGFSTAIDDFGAGYSGLKLLVEYQPHYIKVDRHLIGDIQRDVVRQRIFTGIWRMCNSLAIHIVAEGVEQAGEYLWLQEMGVRYFQGYYFARPAFESLPEIPDKVFCGQ